MRFIIRIIRKLGKLGKVRLSRGVIIFLSLEFRQFRQIQYKDGRIALAACISVMLLRPAKQRAKCTAETSKFALILTQDSCIGNPKHFQSHAVAINARFLILDVFSSVSALLLLLILLLLLLLLLLHLAVHAYLQLHFCLDDQPLYGAKSRQLANTSAISL